MSTQDLARLVPFLDCDPAELAEVDRLARRRTVAAGEPLLRRGEHGGDLLVLVEGEVRVHDERGLDGLLGPGDVLGEMAALGGEPTSADVTAWSTVELLAFGPDDLPGLLAIEPVRLRLRAIATARIEAASASVVTAHSVPVVVAPPRVRGRGAGLHGTAVPARPVRSAVLAGVALLVVGAVVFVLTQRNRTTLVTVDDLVAGLAVEGAGPAPSSDAGAGATRDVATALGVATVAADPPDGSSTDAGEPTPAAPPDGSAPPPGSGAARTEPTAPATDAGAGTEADATTEDAAATEAGATAGGGTTGGDDAPDAGAAPAHRPPASGVYTYDTTGHEKISVAGAAHRYPPQTHAVVHPADDCAWRSEHHVLEEHVDRRTICSAPTHVSSLAFSAEITFFGQSDGVEYLCDPPAELIRDAPPGTRSSGRCRSADGRNTADYAGLFVGREQLDVGGRAVATVHLSVDFTLTGSTRGTAHLEQWLVPETGLPVRMERTTNSLAESAWGDVRYTEEATFHLTSLTPRN